MKAALRFMARFGVAEPLIGDVVEAADQHSRLWLWTQALAAVAQTSINAAVQHPVDAARVAVASGGLLVVGYEVLRQLYLSVLPGHSPLNIFVWRVYLPGHSPLSFFAWRALPLDAVMCLYAASTGWIAVRSSRHNRAALALVAAVAQVPFTLFLIVPLSHRLWVALTVYHRPFNYGWVFQLFVIFIAIPACCLLGGLWSASAGPRRAIAPA